MAFGDNTMTIRIFENKIPNVAPTAYIDPMALVIGDVTIGLDSSIWPMSVLRGDVNHINIGKATNIQDGTIIHVNSPTSDNPEGFPTIIGDRVTVGHQAVIHGRIIEDESLIGMGAKILDGAIIKRHVIVGSGSVVTPGKILESGYLWLGAPARKVRPLTAKEIEFFIISADEYVGFMTRHRASQTIVHSN